MSTAHARAPARRAHVGRTTSRGHVQKSVNVNCRAEAAATHAASARARPAVIAKRGDPQCHVSRWVTQRGGGLGWAARRHHGVGRGTQRSAHRGHGGDRRNGPACGRRVGKIAPVGGLCARNIERMYFLCATLGRSDHTRAGSTYTRADTTRISFSFQLVTGSVFFGLCVRTRYAQTHEMGDGVGPALEVYNRFFFAQDAVAKEGGVNTAPGPDDKCACARGGDINVY